MSTTKTSTPASTTVAARQTVLARRAFAPQRRDDLLLVDPVAIVATYADFGRATPLELAAESSTETIARTAAIDEALAEFADE